MGVTSTPSHLGLLGLPHCPLQPQLVGRGSKVAGARKGEEEEKKKGELSYFQSRPFLQRRMGALGFRLCHPSEANPLTSSGLFPHLQMKVVARVSVPLSTTLGRCQWAVGPQAPPSLCSWPCGQRPPPTAGLLVQGGSWEPDLPAPPRSPVTWGHICRGAQFP